MSYWSAIQRGVLYVGVAVVIQAQNDLSKAFSTDPKEVVGFWLGLVGVTFLTWRGYIDKSPAQVEPSQPVALDIQPPKA